MKNYRAFNQIINNLAKIERNGFSYDAFVMLCNDIPHQLKNLFQAINDEDITTVGGKRKFLTMAVNQCKTLMIIDSHSADVLKLPYMFETFDTDQTFKDVDFNNIQSSEELDKYINKLKIIIDKYLSTLQKKLMFEQAGAVCDEIVRMYNNINEEKVRSEYDKDPDNGVANYAAGQIAKITKLIDSLSPPEEASSKKAFIQVCWERLNTILATAQYVESQENIPESLKNPVQNVFYEKIISFAAKFSSEEDMAEAPTTLEELPRELNDSPYEEDPEGTTLEPPLPSSGTGNIGRKIRALFTKYKSDHNELRSETIGLIRQYISAAEKAQDYRSAAGCLHGASPENLKQQIKSKMKHLSHTDINIVFSALTDSNPDNNDTQQELRSLGVELSADHPITTKSLAFNFIGDVKAAHIAKNEVAVRKAKEIKELLFKANDAFRKGYAATDIHEPLSELTNDIFHSMDEIFIPFKNSATTGSSRFF
jgi:hypothetical protein